MMQGAKEVMSPAAKICEGCLSKDRILTLITNDEMKDVYFSIIDDKLDSTSILLLCWECRAHLRRYNIFKQRCLRARETLKKYKVAPKRKKTLSNLTIITNQSINITNTHTHSFNCKHEECSDQYEFTQEKLKKDLHIVPECPEMSTGDLVLNCEPAVGDRVTVTDVTCVKVEDDEIENTEEYFVDNDFEHQLDDTDFKPVLKSETVKVKSKRNKKKTEEDFDASDEEPLHNKKRIKTEREGSSKRKKKEDVSKGVSPKPRVRKREKAPGVVNNPRVDKKLQQLNVGEGQLEMVVLSWEEVEEERQRALLSVVYTRHEYRCASCILGFNHKFKLDNHMKKHDPSSGELVCGVCQVRCRDSHALGAHRRRHRVRWRCCSCGGAWSRAAVAADHAARAHGTRAPTHVCRACGHAETSLGRLRNHIKNHAERQKCHLCEKTFRDRTSLRTHLFIHKGEKEYSCPRCGKQFLFKKAMEVHLVTHDAPAHLYCYECDMNFKNRMSYTQHMKYSLKHIDPAKLKYACQLCDKKFAKATRLEEHKLAVHLKATPISCTTPGCNFVCSSRPVLRTHVRMVHRNARALRNHVCDACGKTYTTKKTLEGHLRSHTGERPFKCNLCPSTFGYEAALYNHNKLVHLKPKVRRLPPQVMQLQIPEPPT